MVTQVTTLLTLTAALGCGLIAGVFFAFSTFVLRALARLPIAQGIAAMQSINVTVLTPAFLVAFVGTAVLCVAAVASSVCTGGKPATAWLVVAAALYLGGNVVVTGVCNVPRNEALALLDPASTEAADLWRNYIAGWSAWNHVRTVSALLACAALITALYLSRADASTL